ncbi:MAG: DUF2878 domain-containing protein [Rudaea sp.]
MNKWINLILYQSVWLLAVAGAARGWWWAGPIAVAIFAALQLAVSTSRRSDVVLICIAAAAGFVIDSLFARSGALSYASPVPWVSLAPVWIVALWVNFALTLNHSLSYLKSNFVLAAALGGIGAPLAYWAAFKGWNAISFGESPIGTLIVLAFVWAVVTPILCLAANRLRKYDGALPALAGAVS